MAFKCLFSSPRRSLFVFTFLLFQLLPTNIIGATYHSHDITSDTVCNRYRKRELQVYMSDPLILEIRPQTLETKLTLAPLSCVVEVEAKGFFTQGVVSVIQDMKFRKNGEHCIDYVQTISGEDDDDLDMKLRKRKKSKKKKLLKKVVKATVLSKKRRRRRETDYEDDNPRLCGRAMLGLMLEGDGEDGEDVVLPPPFADPLPPNKPPVEYSSVFSWEAPNPYQSVVSDAAGVDHKGEIKTRLHVSNRMLRVDEQLKFKIVYTAYQECSGNDVPDSLFHCGYGLCISRDLVQDGIVNCPFGDCADETDCATAKHASLLADVLEYEPTEETSVWWIILWVLVALALVFLLCCGGIFIYFARRRKN